MTNLVTQFYQDEADDGGMQNISRSGDIKTLSIKVPIQTATMIAAIAERFNIGVSPMLADVITNVAYESFAALSHADKLKLALDADEATVEFWKRDPRVKDATSVHWQYLAEHQENLDIGDSK